MVLNVVVLLYGISKTQMDEGMRNGSTVVVISILINSYLYGWVTHKFHSTVPEHDI